MVPPPGNGDVEQPPDSPRMANGAAAGAPPPTIPPQPNHHTSAPGPSSGTPVAGHNGAPMTPGPEEPPGCCSVLPCFRRSNRIADSYAIEAGNGPGGGGPTADGPSHSSTGEPSHVSVPPQAPLFGGSWRTQIKKYDGIVLITSNFHYVWTMIMTAAFMYNLVFNVARGVFSQLHEGIMDWIWLGLDLTFDLVYAIDIFIRCRTGYLEQGIIVEDKTKIRTKYMKSTQFKFDAFSQIPLDYILRFLPWTSRFHPYIRFNRLSRFQRCQHWLERTETRSAFPNAFRVVIVVVYIVVIIHWNGCFYFLISESVGLGTDSWVYGRKNLQSLPEHVEDTLLRRYIYSFYWSTLILTTIGEVPGPVRNEEFLFVTLDLMCGVLIFATIVGNVGSMISNMSAARAEFQNKMDGVKQYMALRKVSKHLEERVIKWFDYLWSNKQSLNDESVLKVLPDKLQAEIAMHVHFETLKKVRIFQDCEAGLISELVLKLHLQVFSPGDFVCRKGDIGREMYIVKQGKLEVVSEDDPPKVFATLQEGSVFGELSILNITGSKNGNRRTANVRSVGYTDLFVLNKHELWAALKEYPEARKLLMAKGRELLKKDGLLDETSPEEQLAPEDQVDNLMATIGGLQTKMARLIAERTSTETKLSERISFLERQLARYQKPGLRRRSDVLQALPKLGRSVTYAETIDDDPGPSTSSAHLLAPPPEGHAKKTQ